MGKAKSTTLIRGSTEECLVHFGSGIPKGERSRMQPLADFAGLKNTVPVYGWLHKRYLPRGMSLVKTRYFFEKEGYGVIDLEKLNPAVYNLGRLIAHNILTIQEASEKIGLQSNSLLQVLTGKVGISLEKADKMRKVYDEYKSALDARITTIVPPKNAVSSNGSVALATNPVLPVAVESAPVQEKPHDEVEHIHALTINTLGTLITALLPLAEQVVSDKYSADERRHLRELTDVFRASNFVNKVAELLNRLCGETARGLKTTRWNNNKKKHE